MPSHHATPLALLFTATSLLAQVPSDVWNLKEDPGKGIRDAIVLEDKVSFRGTYVEFTYRVRILSEAGKAAAEFNAFSDQSYDFKGRTLTPDGKSVEFNKRKDFQEKTQVQTAFGELKSTKVVPPGLTGNCVVELTWKESCDRDAGSPLPARWGNYGQIPIGNAHFTQVATVELPASFPWSHAVFPTATQKPETSNRGGYRIYTFRNVPAAEPVPYTLDVTRDIPRFVTWRQPEVMTYVAKSGGPDAYWKQAANAFVRPYLESIKVGDRYRALMAELTGGLQGTPAEKASTLLRRLDKRIRNTSRPTHAEAAAKTKKEDKREIESPDLDKAAQKGETDATGMFLLYYQMLRDAGLAPKLGWVADRDRGLFVLEFPCVYQFNDILLGVKDPEKGGMVWFDPGLRWAPPGLVHPNYQGTPGLVIDPATWGHSQLQFPSQPAVFNQRRWIYRVEMGEEEDRFKLKALFSGYPEYAERRDYLALDLAGQSKKLKEDFSERLKEAEITRAEVLNAQNPDANLEWVVEGRREQDSGRRRTVSPFPGMPSPVWIPPSLPAQRKDPIVIPYQRIVLAESVITLPQGFRHGTFTPLVKSNPFGVVRWSAEATEAEGKPALKVSLRVESHGLFFPASEYGAFKEFLGWVDDARSRTLILEKGQ